MKIKNQLTLARLIGKIDNDFNISESDWIPRVAAWVTDALSQMNVLPMIKKRRSLEVSERVAQFPCVINSTELKVFDENGREIPEYSRDRSCGCPRKSTSPVREIGVFNGNEVEGVDVATVVSDNSRNFVLDCDKIILNFDAYSITVESYEVATYHDDYYDCECPYIYNDGLLLEALEWYVLFKYLSRGSNHPIYSLKSSSPVTNPWIQWNTLRPKAINSVKAKLSDLNSGWNNFFYNSTFLPRG